jgi:hypothetical protein
MPVIRPTHALSQPERMGGQRGVDLATPDGLDEKGGRLKVELRRRNSPHDARKSDLALRRGASDGLTHDDYRVGGQDALPSGILHCDKPEGDPDRK